MRIPFETAIRLRPQVRLFIRTAKFNRNQMIHLATLFDITKGVVISLRIIICRIDCSLGRGSDVAYAFAIVGFAYHSGRNRVATIDVLAHQFGKARHGFGVFRDS